MKKLLALAPLMTAVISLEAGAHPSMVEGNVAMTFTTRGPVTTTSPATAALM